MRQFRVRVVITSEWYAEVEANSQIEARGKAVEETITMVHRDPSMLFAEEHISTHEVTEGWV